MSYTYLYNAYNAYNTYNPATVMLCMLYMLYTLYILYVLYIYVSYDGIVILLGGSCYDAAHSYRGRFNARQADAAGGKRRGDKNTSGEERRIYIQAMTFTDLQTLTDTYSKRPNRHLHTYPPFKGVSVSVGAVISSTLRNKIYTPGGLPASFWGLKSGQDRAKIRLNRLCE